MGKKQIVTFRVDDCLVGLDILEVREINRFLDITPVQHAPEYVLGLMNLRGQMVTVFDLGVRLGLTPREISSESHNVILKNEPVGLLVDAIGEVVQAEGHEIEAPPANLHDIEGEFIAGVLELVDGVLVILSAEKLLHFRMTDEGLQKI